MKKNGIYFSLIALVGLLVLVSGCAGGNCSRVETSLNEIQTNYNSFKQNLSSKYKLQLQDNFTTIENQLESTTQLINKGRCEEAEKELSKVSGKIQKLIRFYVEKEREKVVERGTQTLSCSVMNFDVDLGTVEVSDKQFEVLIYGKGNTQIKALILGFYKDGTKIEEVERTVNLSPGAAKLVNTTTEASLQGVDKVVIKSKNCPGTSKILTKSGGSWQAI